MLEAYSPTPRKFYTYLAMISAGGGGLFMLLVSFAAGNPLDVTGSLILAGGLGGGIPALLVGANAVCAERAAWFNYQAALASAKVTRVPMPDPENDVRLKYTRGGNIRSSTGFHIIKDMNAEDAKKRAKQQAARTVYDHTMEIVARADVPGDLDGTPAQLLVDVNRGMWLIAQHVDRLDWKFGERRWSEGDDHPFSLPEYKLLIKYMIEKRLMTEPPRGNVAPTPTRAGVNVLNYYKQLPHCPEPGPVVVG